MSRSKRALHGTLATLGQYVMQMLLQFFLAPMVVLYAGKETLGAFSAIFQFVNYLAFLDLGISMALERYLARAVGEEDTVGRFNLLLTTGRSYLLASNTVNAVLVVIFALHVGQWLKLKPEVAMDARMSLMMLAAWVVIRTPILLSGVALHAMQDLAFRNSVTIVENFTRLCASLLLVWLGFGMVGLIMGSIASELLDNVVCSFRLRRRNMNIRPSWGIPDWRLLGDMVKFGGFSFVINMALRLIYYTDNFIAGRVISASAASVYYSTQMPTQQAWFSVSMVMYNAIPAINELHARGEYEHLRRAYLRLLRYTLLLVFPIAGGVLLLNHAVVRLWMGKDFFGGELMTAALAATVILYTAAGVNHWFVVMTGRIRSFACFLVVIGVIKTFVSVICAIKFELGGIALATTAASLVHYGYLQVRAKREIRITAGKIFREAVLPALLTGGVGVAFLWVLCQHWLPETWPAIITIMAIYLPIQGALIYCALLRDDRLLVLEQIGAVLGIRTRVA